MSREARVLDVGSGGSHGAVVCVRCRLRVRFAETDSAVVADLLASHWFDDHGLVHWRDRAAEGRDRLWRSHPELLERLGELAGEGKHPRTG